MYFLWYEEVILWGRTIAGSYFYLVERNKTVKSR